MMMMKSKEIETFSDMCSWMKRCLFWVGGKLWC